MMFATTFYVVQLDHPPSSLLSECKYFTSSIHSLISPEQVFFVKSGSIELFQEEAK